MDETGRTNNVPSRQASDILHHSVCVGHVPFPRRPLIRCWRRQRQLDGVVWSRHWLLQGFDWRIVLAGHGPERKEVLQWYVVARGIQLMDCRIDGFTLLGPRTGHFSSVNPALHFDRAAARRRLPSWSADLPA